MEDEETVRQLGLAHIMLDIYDFLKPQLLVVFFFFRFNGKERFVKKRHDGERMTLLA